LNGTTTGGSATDTDTTGTSTSTSDNSTSTSGSRSTRRGHLPRTGSSMPLVGVIGFLSLALALGLKASAPRRNS
jgi:LPXTG-motif cell wall-anchored protein